MSTSYGSATVQFPGFKPVSSGTTDGRLNISSWRKIPRSLEFADGSRLRLSKRERSRLLTLSKKWKTGRRRNGRDYSFNTLEVEHW